jgi:hypothetical protein
MLLKRELLEQIRAGEVDLIFRRWSRPTVRAGGTLKTRLGVLAINAIDDTDPGRVTEEEARRAGFADHAAFHAWLATMKPGHLFQRISVSWLADAE